MRWTRLVLAAVVGVALWAGLPGGAMAQEPSLCATSDLPGAPLRVNIADCVNAQNAFGTACQTEGLSEALCSSLFQDYYMAIVLFRVDPLSPFYGLGTPMPALVQGFFTRCLPEVGDLACRRLAARVGLLSP